MTRDEAIKILKDYVGELDGILSRFIRTRDGIHIYQEDDPRFRQLVIELRDFLDDIVGKNTYSAMIINFFNEGISNFTGSPSYKSVENIRGIVSSVITRIERNPEILLRVQGMTDDRHSPSKTEPDFPDKVTLSWLLKHVPVSLWIAGAGLLAATFVTGIQASRISLVKEIFRLEVNQEAAKTLPSVKHEVDKTDPKQPLKKDGAKNRRAP